LPLQQGEVNTTYADISKAKTEIGYNPKYDIETGIKKFVEWNNSNKSNLYKK
jgi:UDP-glucuronate 4-epimerase